jgi:hypothetical protein
LQTFTSVFPIVRHLLHAQQPQDRLWIVTDAFDVLKLHSDPSAPYPHRQMIPLLYRILETRGPGAAKTLLPNLQSSASALGPDQLQVTTKSITLSTVLRAPWLLNLYTWGFTPTKWGAHPTIIKKVTEHARI